MGVAVGPTTAAAAQAVTQVQMEVLALQEIMVAAIIMEALAHLATRGLMETQEQMVRALQQETQAILEPQAALETTEQVLQAVVLGARLRLLGLAKQVPQVRQVRQELRLPT